MNRQFPAAGRRSWDGQTRTGRTAFFLLSGRNPGQHGGPVCCDRGPRSEGGGQSRAYARRLMRSGCCTLLLYKPTRLFEFRF
jgi:hypothetical protein